MDEIADLQNCTDTDRERLQEMCERDKIECLAIEGKKHQQKLTQMKAINEQLNEKLI